MNPFRGVFVFIFALTITTGIGFFPSVAYAQKSVQGEFQLQHSTRWGDDVLPEGDYIYVVDLDASHAVVRVWQKGGGFSDSFVPQRFVQGNHLGESGIVLQ
ncbi:MAG: hypothetical protein ACRD4Y_17425, partial [Candidatus Acidiferrales bacterium]